MQKASGKQTSHARNRCNGERMRRIVCTLLVVGSASAWSATDDDAVTLHYILRPPYMVPTASGLSGLTGGPTEKAFRRAKVPFVLAQTPFARQLHMLETNSGRDCMIGMFYKPERERFARYTKPIYQDRPQIILTETSNAPRFSKFKSLTELLDDKSMTLLVKLGYSYSIALDKLFEQYKPKTITTADENLLMLKSIKLNHADYMFIAPEEAEAAIVAAGYQLSDFSQIKYADMPNGDFRHIMCSKNVPEEVIQKLNAAIEFAGRKKP
jgi:uncharacterized protein (TIGR02285 family)